MLIFSFGAFAQKDSLAVEKLKERIAENRRLNEMQEIKRQKEEQRKRLVQDSIQLAFNNAVAEFEMKKAKLDSLSRELGHFEEKHDYIKYNCQTALSILDLRGSNRSENFNHLFSKDFHIVTFDLYPPDTEECFPYHQAIRKEVSFFEEELNKKISDFIFNDDIIYSLASSYKELYGKEIAILFVEKKLKETYSVGNKKQNLTLLLTELK